MEKIEIKASNKKIAAMAIGCIAIAIIGYVLYADAENYTSYVYKNSDFIKIAGIITAILFGIGFIVLSKMALQKKIGLLIDEKGITDNSSAVNIGLIRWEDMQAVRITNIMSTKFILIDITNQEHYLERIKSKFKLKLVQYNIKMYGTPISLASSTLQCNFEDLENQIRKSLERYKGKKLD